MAPQARGSSDPVPTSGSGGPGPSGPRPPVLCSVRFGPLVPLWGPFVQISLRHVKLANVRQVPPGVGWGLQTRSNCWGSTPAVGAAQATLNLEVIDPLSGSKKKLWPVVLIFWVFSKSSGPPFAPQATRWAKFFCTPRVLPGPASKNINVENWQYPCPKCQASPNFV